jgi:aspartate aminotransferase, mitochondrial
LNVVCKSKEQAEAVHSQLQVLIRAIYSNPPIYGARVVATVFSTPELKSIWEKDVKVMADRIKFMRNSLVENLKSAGSKKNWDHITRQIGMFAFSGLTPEEVEEIKNKHHIYMTKDGRISISGLNTKNIEFVSKSIHDVTK